MSCGVSRAWCAQQRNRWSAVADALHGFACLARATAQPDVGGRKRMAWRRSAAARHQVGHPRVAALRALSACNRATGGTGARQRAWRWGQQRGRCIALLTSTKRHRHSRTDTSPPQRQVVASLHQRQPVTSLHWVKRTRLPRVSQYRSAQRQPSTGPPSVTTYQSAAPRPSISCTTSGPTPPVSSNQL